jgi:hypothetical protein
VWGLFSEALRFTFTVGSVDFREAQSEMVAAGADAYQAVTAAEMEIRWSADDPPFVEE